VRRGVRVCRGGFSFDKVVCRSSTSEDGCAGSVRVGGSKEVSFAAGSRSWSRPRFLKGWWSASYFQGDEISRRARVYGVICPVRRGRSGLSRGERR